MSKFNVGDPAVCVNRGFNSWVSEGNIYQVIEVETGSILIYNNFGSKVWYREELFELARAKVLYPNPPHKHKDLIIAWANGAEIEYKGVGEEVWKPTKTPAWHGQHTYRIKPHKTKKQLLKEELQAKAQELLDKIKELENE